VSSGRATSAGSTSVGFTPGDATSADATSADATSGGLRSRGVLVEICVDDVAGAVVADREGADRVELCADLLEGGTTPSIGTVTAVLRAVERVGVQVIVRPRGGDFVHDDAELDLMCLDLEAIARVAATEARTPVGVVLGVLTPAGEVDEAALRRLVAAAAPLPVTFHKAFDATVDPLAAWERLRAAGVVRVLTSGGPHPAAEGTAVLAELVHRSRTDPGAPAVLVGGAVRPANVRAIVAATGATEVHLRAQVPSPRGDGTLRTDPGTVRAVLAALAETALADTALADTALADTALADTALADTALADTALAEAAPDGAGPRYAVPAGGADEGATPAPVAGPAPAGPTGSAVVVAVDVGGTTIKGALVDARGRTTELRTVEGTGTGADAVARLVDLLVALRGSAERQGQQVLGVGVVTPGLVDAATGTVRYASTLGWTDLPLGAILSAELGLPVEVDHDVRSSGLAERRFGAAGGAEDAVLVVVGTGVAASVVSGGHAVVGALAAAGELGHVPVLPDGEACTCGQRGCLEVYCSGAGIARRWAAAGGAPGLDAAAVAARLGSDPVADRVWSDAVHALALGLASVTLLVDPATVVVAGGVSRAGEALLAPLRVELSRALAWREAPELRTSTLGTSGGRIGAAVLAFTASGHGDLVDGWTTADVTAEVPTAG